MGLDMYLTGEKFLFTDWRNDDNNRKEDGFQIGEVHLRLGYWRKHADLHGHIVRTYGPKDEHGEPIDDCSRIYLNADSLRALIEACKDPSSMPTTTGFFFGASSKDKAEIEEDVAIFTGALAWLEAQPSNEARSVNYRASW